MPSFMLSSSVFYKKIRYRVIIAHFAGDCNGFFVRYGTVFYTLDIAPVGLQSYRGWFHLPVRSVFLPDGRGLPRRPAPTAACNAVP